MRNNFENKLAMQYAENYELINLQAVIITLRQNVQSLQVFALKRLFQMKKNLFYVFLREILKYLHKITVKKAEQLLRFFS